MSDLRVISDSINKLDEWLSQNDWKAFDPFDGLSSNVSFLTFNNHYLRIMLQQSVRRFPINVRPLLGIEKQTGSKGMGFCALGYLKLYHTTQQKEYLEKTKLCLDWLMKNFSNGYAGYSWGNHFSYESRGGTIPLGVPTIVWTSLIANVFMDAFESLHEQKYLDVAKSAGNFILSDIGRHQEPDGSLCFMYTPQHKERPSLKGAIHNSNVLGAWLLARLSKHSNNGNLFHLSNKSIRYSAKHQLPDGGWYYGEHKQNRWVDSFHTGYVLESIHGYTKATGDETYKGTLIKGYKYFKTTFFKEDGTPRYYNFKTYPIDIQCASQGIQTLVNLREYDDTSIDLAKKVAFWAIKHMQDPKGFFYFRKYPFITNKTPMFHWGQATMLAALSSLLEVSTANL